MVTPPPPGQARANTGLSPRCPKECGQCEQALPWNCTGTHDKCCHLSGNTDVPVDTVCIGSIVRSLEFGSCGWYFN